MKKLLALVLALVMSMSLVTISNADFNDADEISYAEAVEVMNAVGVLAGYDNGDFGPTDTLTRAQAAKIIAYLDLGEKAADAIKGSGTVFSDVPATAWYAGYVEYCAGAGYVSGVGNGKFDPDANVTGVQFAKMLLCVLGYKAEIEGYNGTDWSLSIVRDANKIDLFDGLSIVTSAALTREQAAQMAFNALTATVVEYQGGTNVSTSDGTTVTVNATRNEVKRTSGTDYHGTSETSTGTQQLCEKLYGSDLKLNDSDTDDFGAPASTWTYKADEVGTYASEADATFTGEVKYGELYTAIGSTALKTANVGTYTSKIDNNTGSVVKNSITKGSKTVVPGTGNGVTTYVYVDEDNTSGTTKYDITIVQVNTYVGKVSSVTKATASADRYVSIANKGTTISSFDTKYETESFEKDDYVLFTVAYNSSNSKYEIVNAVAAESFETAEVTAVKVSSNFTAGGTTYKYAKTYGGATIALENEYTVVLDANGYVAFAELYNGANDYSKYLVITKDAAETNLGSDIVANAVAMDGTLLSAIKLNKLDGTKINAVSTDTTSGVTKVTLNQLYSFTKNSDGKYDLKTVAAPYTAATLTSASNVGATGYSFYAGNTTIGTVSGSAYVANNDTTFVVYNSADDEVKVYDGIKNMVNILTTDFNNAAVMYKTAPTAKLVYIDVNDSSDNSASAKDLVYLLSTTAVQTKDGDDDVFTYDAIVDGEKSTVSDNSGSIFTAKGLYYISAYDGEYVKTAVTGSSSMPTDYAYAYVNGYAMAVSGGVATINGTGYVLADDCAIYSIDADDNVTVIGADSLESDDTNLKYTIVTYTEDNVTEAVVIYVAE